MEGFFLLTSLGTTLGAGTGGTTTCGIAVTSGGASISILEGSGGVVTFAGLEGRGKGADGGSVVNGTLGGSIGGALYRALFFSRRSICSEASRAGSDSTYPNGIRTDNAREVKFFT
jgi:hypothetical protein